MKNLRWILLAGLLVTAPQLAQAQPPAAGAPGTTGTTATTDQGGISSGAATTTTTTTTAVAPVAPDTNGVPPEDAATPGETSSNAPDTGGEPMLVVLGGLTVAAMAFGLRRKVGVTA